MTDVTKFIDKKTGNIHIGDLVIGKDLKWEDGERLAPFAKVDADEEVCCMEFTEKLNAGGIDMRVRVVLFSPNYMSYRKMRIELVCNLPKEAYDCGIEQNYVVLDASKKWLKAVLGEPDEDDEEFICYKYDWGRITAYVGHDQRNDLRGGEINFRYNME